MAKFELDSTMMGKLEKIARLSLILNSLDGRKTKAQLQIGHSRMLLSLQHDSGFGIEVFPLYTFQSSYYNLTYRNLDEVIDELNYFIKNGD